jgi:outer membrane protein assembly factor BamB
MKEKILAMLCILLLSYAGAEVGYLTLENKFNARMEITDIFIDDVNGDGKKEVLAGSYDSKVYLLDSGMNQIWKHDAKSYVFSVATRKIDGKKQIVVGAASLRILDLSGTVLERINTADPVKKIVVGDIDADGKDEIVAVANSVRNNEVYIFNSDLAITAQKNIKGEFNGALTLLDVNGDGKKEIVIGASDIYAYDKDMNLVWVYKMQNPVFDIAAADIDNCGKPEIIAGSKPNVIALNLLGKLMWEYNTSGTVKSIRVSDLEGDGKDDIIIGSDKLYRLDANGKLIWSFATVDEVNYISIGDINWDGTEEIAVATQKIYVVGADGKAQWEYEPYRVATRVFIEDLSGSGRKEDLIASGADYNVYLFKTREVYIKETRSYTLFEEATNLFGRGMYPEAKAKIDEALLIKDSWNVGKCAKDLNSCTALRQKIVDKIPTTTTTVAATSTTTEASTTTTEAQMQVGGFDLMLPAVVIIFILVVLAVYFIRIR